jgi:galactose mutarotase-like enzyme
MTEVRFSETSVGALRALTLDNGVLLLTILPELGGKISRFRDLRTGREWLWTNERLPYRRLGYGASYVEKADTGGWDECFPTVAECSYPLPPWKGARMPDHGELWPQAWPTEVERTGEALSIRTMAKGVVLPYEFERRLKIEPSSDTLRLDYRVTSTADSDLSFIWSTHPLFAIEPGMRVLLPDDARIRAFMSVPDGLFPEGEEEYSWPPRLGADDGELDLEHLPPASARVAFKLWSQPLRKGWAALRARDGAEFRFAFDPGLVPQVGLWLNAGGWSGAGGEPYYNLALEPCIGAQDSLQEAVERYGQYGTLPAHGVREWWIEASSKVGGSADSLQA